MQCVASTDSGFWVVLRTIVFLRIVPLGKSNIEASRSSLNIAYFYASLCFFLYHGNVADDIARRGR